MPARIRSPEQFTKNGLAIGARLFAPETTNPVVTRAAENLMHKKRIIGLIRPFLPPSESAKCPSIGRMDGRGGGDRKLNLLSQVLSCQRRSAAALLQLVSNGVI